MVTPSSVLNVTRSLSVAGSAGATAGALLGRSAVVPVTAPDVVEPGGLHGVTKAIVACPARRVSPGNVRVRRRLRPAISAASAITIAPPAPPSRDVAHA